MNSAKRSTRCDVLVAHAPNGNRPRRGTQYMTMGPARSRVIAQVQSVVRAEPSAMPPAIQRTPEGMNQTTSLFPRPARSEPTVETSNVRKSRRPTLIAT
jgi:hypothetical protein